MLMTGGFLPLLSWYCRRDSWCLIAQLGTVFLEDDEVYLIRVDTRNSVKNQNCDVYPDKGSVIYNTKSGPLWYEICLKKVEVIEWSMRLKNNDPEDWNGSGPAVIYQTTDH